jgi:hypothetical protein
MSDPREPETYRYVRCPTKGCGATLYVAEKPR